MRRRMVVGAVMAAVALLAVPAAGQAEEVDTRCSNGSEPVHYQLTDLSPLVKVQLRVLCVRD